MIHTNAQVIKQGMMQLLCENRAAGRSSFRHEIVNLFGYPPSLSDSSSGEEGGEREGGKKLEKGKKEKEKRKEKDMTGNVVDAQEAKTPKENEQEKSKEKETEKNMEGKMVDAQEAESGELWWENRKGHQRDARGEGEGGETHVIVGRAGGAGRVDMREEGIPMQHTAEIPESPEASKHAHLRRPQHKRAKCAEGRGGGGGGEGGGGGGGRGGRGSKGDKSGEVRDRPLARALLDYDLKVCV